MSVLGDQHLYLPNGSYATFGGNDTVSVGAPPLSSLLPISQYRISFFSFSNKGYGPPSSTDYDDRKSIRIQPRHTLLQEMRWYSAAEALADGAVVLICGFAIVRWQRQQDHAQRRPHIRGRRRDAHLQVLSFKGSCYHHVFHDNHLGSQLVRPHIPRAL